MAVTHTAAAAVEADEHGGTPEKRRPPITDAQRRRIEAYAAAAAARGRGLVLGRRPLAVPAAHNTSSRESTRSCSEGEWSGGVAEWTHV